MPLLTKLTIDDGTKRFKHFDKLQKILNIAITRITKIATFQLQTGLQIKTKEGFIIRDILKEEYKRCFVENREEHIEKKQNNKNKIQEDKVTRNARHIMNTT